MICSHEGPPRVWQRNVRKIQIGSRYSRLASAVEGRGFVSSMPSRRYGGSIVSEMEAASETCVEGAKSIPLRRNPRRWTLRGFAVFATAVMVLVAFSQNVGSNTA